MGIGQSGQHGTNVVILVEVESNTGKDIARIHNQCMVGRLVVEILPTLIYVTSKHAQVCFTWDILSAWFYMKYINYLSLMYLCVLVVSYQVGVLIYFFHFNAIHHVQCSMNLIYNVTPRNDLWTHKTSLSRQLFAEVPVSNQESEC